MDAKQNNEKTVQTDAIKTAVDPVEAYQQMLQGLNISEEEARKILERTLVDPSPPTWQLTFGDTVYTLRGLTAEESQELGENPTPTQVLEKVLIDANGKAVAAMPPGQRQMFIKAMSKSLVDLLYNFWREKVVTYYMVCMPVAVDFFSKKDRR